MNVTNIVLDKQEPTDVLVSELDTIVNGSVSNIHCYILDFISYNDRIPKLVSIFKKLSNRGTATIKFLDMLKISNDYLNGKISSQKLSEIISSIKSTINVSDIESLVSENRHISILKCYHENNHSVVVIQKNI
jgi:hypothetical protein